MSFSLANKIRINTKASNLDLRYGPWLNEAAAKSGIVEGLRDKGLTVGIYVPNNDTNSPVVEYWWRDGTADSNLVLKAGTDLNTVTNYLSTNNVRLLSATVSDTLNAASAKITNLSAAFFAQAGTSISGTVSATGPFLIGNTQPLTGNGLVVDGNVRINGKDLSMVPNITALDTDGQSLFDLRSASVSANYNLSIAASGVGNFMKLFGGRGGDERPFIVVKTGAPLRIASYTNFYNTNDDFTEHVRINTASGNVVRMKVYGSVEEGQGTNASGTNAHAEGGLTDATGSHSHAEGYDTFATGIYTHAENLQTSAVGYASHAEGNITKAMGINSHSEGYNTTASGEASHAEGAGTTSSGTGSHAEGVGCAATGNSSHAEGGNTTASGQGSHAEGNFTKAVGVASHAAGHRAVAQQNYTYAWSDGDVGGTGVDILTTRAGQYMVSASGGMFIPVGRVGIGTDSLANALTVVGNVSATRFYGDGSNITGITAGTANAVSFPRTFLTIVPDANLSNTNNGVDSRIQWNVVNNTHSNVLSGNTDNRNIEIKQTGTYRIEVRYATYDLLSPTNFLRVQLRTSEAGVMTSGTGGTLFRTIDQGYIGTTGNGEAMKHGTVTVTITAAPTWMIATFLHSGATGVGGSGNTGYPVVNNVLGTQPYWRMERISD